MVIQDTQTGKRIKQNRKENNIIKAERVRMRGACRRGGACESA